MPDALALLAGQTWRGNIRELRNVLEQAAMRSEDTAINAEQLREVLRSSGVEPAAPAPGPETALAPSPAHNSPADTDLLRPLAQQVAELNARPSPPPWPPTAATNCHGAPAGHLAGHAV